MMLPVTDEEVTALDELLDARLREMRMEIAHTDDRAGELRLGNRAEEELQVVPLEKARRHGKVRRQSSAPDDAHLPPRARRRVADRAIDLLR